MIWMEPIKSVYLKCRRSQCLKKNVTIKWTKSGDPKDFSFYKSENWLFRRQRNRGGKTKTVFHTCGGFDTLQAATEARKTGITENGEPLPFVQLDYNKQEGMGKNGGDIKTRSSHRFVINSIGHDPFQ